MPISQLTRRDILMKCAALGSLSVVSPFSLTEALAAWELNAQGRTLKPTPWNEIGPFYKRRAPHTAHLRASGDPGLPLAVSGQILGTDASIVPNAVVEVWQTDHFGHYDVDGYRYRATLAADASGNYSFDSVMPGHYPDRVCQHIHYMVSAPGYKPLTTQLYFATDPVFEGDPDKNFTRDPLITSRELVRPIMLQGDPKDIHAAISFPIVLERL
jgi:protocatechuate 3,4-dioxygenase beta subunit